MKWNYMISILNNDDRPQDVLSFFGSFETFFNVLGRDKQAIKKLKPINKTWEDNLRFWCLKNDRELFNYFLEDFGVFFIDDSYYYKINNPKDLSKLFCWNTGSKEDFYSFFDKKFEYFDYDEWGFVSDENMFALYNNLTSENKNYFHNFFLDMFKEHKIYICSEHMQKYSSNLKYIVIDKSNIEEILSDYDSFLCILENDASDVYYKLESVLAKVFKIMNKNYFVDHVVDKLNTMFDIDKKTFLNLEKGSLLKLNNKIIEFLETYDGILHETILEFIESSFHCLEPPFGYFKLSFDRKNQHYSRLVINSNKIFKNFFD